VHKSIYHTSYFDEFTTVLLHAGDDEKVERLFYAAFGNNVNKSKPYSGRN
jgi:hypothetical protein